LEKPLHSNFRDGFQESMFKAKADGDTGGGPQIFSTVLKPRVYF